MIPIVALAVTGGALAASFKFYEDKIKEKMLETPLVHFEQSAWLTPLRNEARALWNDKRQQQLEKIASATNLYEVSEEEKEIDHYLLVSATTMGVALIGKLLYPPLILWSLAGTLYCIVPLYQAAYDSIVKKRKITVDILYAFTHTAVLFKGLFVVIALGSLYYFVSHKLLLRARERFEKNVIQIVKESPTSVWVLLNDKEIQRPLDMLQVGEVVVIQAGETIPIDGMIVDGVASIDQHILTGEAQPVEKSIGDSVFASTTLLSGRICIEVEKAGHETVVEQIGQILNQTENAKNKQQLWAEWLTDQTVLPIIALAGVTFPFLGIESAAAIIDTHTQRRGIIATPISTINFLNLASEQGILVKDGRALEQLGEVDTVIFDKTGTLTLDQPHVERIHTYNFYTEEMVLTYAAAIEARQPHPIGKAIFQEGVARGLTLPKIDEARYHIGYGLKVTLDRRLIRVGSARFMEMEGVKIPPEVAPLIGDAQQKGVSIVMVAINNQLAGLIELQATLRPGTKEMIQSLRDRNLTIYIISGDHEYPTKKLAHTLGIHHYFAETLPEDKAQIVERLQSEGRKVCFVGDGINDAIALQKAHVSISLGDASVAAVDTAQILLMNAEMKQLVHLLDLVKDAKSNLRNTILMLTIPPVIGITGVLFFGFGIAQVELTSQSSFVLALSNAMLPQWRAKFSGEKSN